MEQPLDILLPRHTLEEALGTELAKQYRLWRGEDCVYMPLSDGSRYLCSCGCVNGNGEACRECGRQPEFLERDALEKLRKEAAQRLAIEDEERARQEAQRREEEARLRKQKQRKKIFRVTAIAAACIAAVALGIGAFWGITRVAIPSYHYRSGLKALEKADYKEAHRQFVMAGIYKDAETYASRFYTPCSQVCSTYGFAGGLTKFEYDVYGRLILTTEAALKKDADGELRESGEPKVYRRVFDARGNALEEQDWNGKTVYSYNEHGDVLTEIRYQPDEEEGHSKTFCYVYDEQERIIQVDEICSNFISLSYSYEQMVQYTYDEKGRVATKRTQTNYPATVESNYITDSVWVYDEQDRPVCLEEVTTCPYDELSSGVKRSTWRYDQEGREVECVVSTEYDRDPRRNTVQTTRCSYNSDGKMTQMLQETRFPNDPTRNATILQSWEYNWEGRLVEERHSLEFVDEEYQNYSGYTNTNLYRYDLLGRMRESVESWEYSDSERNSQKTMTYEYGSDGMVEKAVSEMRADGEISESTIFYNDNGLEMRTEALLEDGKSVSEYDYTYFYYPEGTEKPQETVSQMLYG